MSYSGFDHECMALALRLARKGICTTHPNPRVGCVISKDGAVIGTGWHRAAGEPHAEVFALAEAGDQARGSTVYTTLEPCSHAGRTPPCADQLIQSGISRLVCAMEDPNPRVDGGGIERLREAGVEVRLGLMKGQALMLNQGFIKRMASGLPWVRIKAAQSLDGRTALSNGESQWISSEQSRADVQRWRARSDAILTGIGTVVADNPRMTVRDGAGLRQPLRVIVDSSFRVDPKSRVFLEPGAALVVGCEDGPQKAALEASGIECCLCDQVQGRVDLRALLRLLGKRNINEIQVEAGATLCGALLMGDLVDEVLLYQAATLLGDEAHPAFSIGVLEAVTQGVRFDIRESIRVGADWRFRLTRKLET